MIVTPPQVCECADVELAHELLRTHLTCRVARCVWKAAAYYTLIDAGRLVPQTATPRERSAARGIAFPPLDSAPLSRSGPTVHTLREVLDKLSELAQPIPRADITNGGDNQPSSSGSG
ncbi:hypothetical protein [Nocardia pseudovaccinii]|uniref:hypothetical protein n=1 Tax=Nocardia pseudovaccinii TaxID=189540 RepID=UPI000A3E0829|nr:hypothetical protein [Nocardia pseudovaccinii]